MSTPFDTSFPSADATVAAPAKKSAFRQFLNDVWTSYCKHSEMDVMIRSGRWLNRSEMAKFYENQK